MNGRGRFALSLTRVVRAAQGLHASFERIPSTVRTIFVVTLLLAGAGYGAVRDHHLEEAGAALRDVREALANYAGFRVAEVALVGNKRLTREDIFGLAGITDSTSLLFLDAAAVRDKLKSTAWIADATVLKLYPDRLHIAIVERQPFALWQVDGRVVVIAADGTVVEKDIDARFADFPLVVGRGAESRARDMIALIDRHPAIREQVQALVLVAERRWNLRMRNGIDVQLPEFQPERALEQLVALDRDKKILTRDIESVDLRLADRVTVRLSETSARAREEAMKELTKKKKGGDA
ncbi:MAG: FtsQ-type POTRA domain-containing protein [Pseudorhodoplanes sp.]|nr:FtsQ-type POTRA domain-containing protein [Pseudorhodoplanes sp.]